MKASGALILRIPVLVYTTVLSLMLFSGFATWFRGAWGGEARIAAIVEGLLFFLSDMMLAWDRFIQRSGVLRVGVIVSYHLAQLALVLVIGLAP